MRGRRAGLFATRSPYRPNPIGLSLVKLEGVDGDTLQLSGVDLVDGTPIIDIKPYVPQYDSPLAMPGGLGESSVRIAPWLEEVQTESLEVDFSPAANRALQDQKGALLCDSEVFRRTLVQCLESDPRPLYRWRRERTACSSDYQVQIDGIAAHCRFERAADGTERVLVEQIFPAST